MELNISQRKEIIIVTAIDLIHENGFQNVSTKEIAKRVGISEGLIFKLYPKKCDLFMAVLEHFSLYDKDMFKTSEEKYENPMDALMFFLNKFLVYYENYPEITAIYQMLDMQTGFPEIESKAKEIDNCRLNFIRQLITKAQETGYIDNTEDPFMITDIIYMIFKGMSIKWRTTEYNFSLSEKTNYAVNLFLKSINKH